MAVQPLPHMATTLALPALQNLTWDQIFDEHHDRMNLVIQSIKLFCYSYPDIMDNDHHLYDNRLVEYVLTIGELYNVVFQDEQTILNTVNQALNECQQSVINVNFTAKNVFGRDNALDIQLYCWDTGGAFQPVQMNLDMDQDEQIGVTTFLAYPFGTLAQMKRDNVRFHMSMNGHGWHPNFDNQDFIDFEVEMSQIHGEGLQVEHDFGKGVTIIFEISFEVTSIYAQTPDQKDFHMYTLYHMLNRRADQYTQGLDVDWSHHKERTVPITCERPPVLYNTYELFWRAVDPQTTNSVHCFDLQKGYNYTVDSDERVCLCNEWCNWTAFFAYNPIYRFIIVQNNQLMLLVKYNIPDLYVLAQVLMAHIRATAQIPKAGR